MQTSDLLEFGSCAIVVILIFLPQRRPRKPRFRPRSEPTDAEINERRQACWEAYLDERAGTHKTQPAEQQPSERPPDG
jgi:hypothetical protein